MLVGAQRRLSYRWDRWYLPSSLFKFGSLSLFTNTPIPQSIEIIKNRLQKDKSLKKRTLLAPDDIVELLNFVLTTTYFVFRGQVYQQKFGTAMGSPVSPIGANLFMEDLEQRAMESAPDGLRPKFWK